MRLPVLWLILALPLAVRAEEPTFAGKNPLVDQWKDDLARMRAERKPQPVEGCLYSEGCSGTAAMTPGVPRSSTSAG